MDKGEKRHFFRIKVSFLPFDPSYLQNDRLGLSPKAQIKAQNIRKGLDTLSALRLERQAAFSGIHRNIGFTDKSARKQLFGKLVFKLGLDSPL